MSNCETINLPSLAVEQYQVREVLRCLLQTIIFNRALGPVRPREVDSELFDITYVQCGDEKVDAKIEEKINQFYAWVEKHPGKRGQVCLSFFEKRRKQAWFSKQEERLYWEQWCINVSIIESNTSIQEQSSFTPQTARAKRHARLQAAVEELMDQIIRTVNDKKDHVPPVVSASTVTFPFDVTIAGEGGLSFGLDSVKRMLMQTAPPPVLS
ncbi:hypothetical protein WJX72_006313 [[Myrmecia] bisecta]|uniref:Autophagy-related protein 101 n=1 Tax=[Myrmecia] bisecta TaxID=41462 RepID=A0AAW1P0Y0_9CHLO